MTTPPKRAAQFLLMLQADSGHHLARALDGLAAQIRSGEMCKYEMGGDAFSSYKCRLTIAEYPTHDEYMRQLEHWIGRNESSTGDAE
ncbi:hypothetical protein ABEG10_13655 [Burkholderia cenocepacia]|uniref:hypothetical protein n=1 Tax=Burkholderia cenocepacia TaxID=95486 RepID=UPI00209F4EB9|nr:hypothetical protein [Burkholderia cenocepacia]MCO8421428.1 hypothetical protein [Burkholderia cenocepacia]MCO8471124.1 hypothetical protein [Burkholderia cenocepacia]MCO8476454.1 hypothetical protein [Burkholderia cenocepacia]MCO8486681.1 hypothetical protein [Burkholderia cenocepacia]MCO8502521.1 hypothetical protein [Burkholderia cenocepacia]